jgi:hypothetical protein
MQIDVVGSHAARRERSTLERPPDTASDVALDVAAAVEGASIPVLVVSAVATE